MSNLKLTALYKGPVLDKKLEAFAKSGNRLQNEAHKLACSVLAHVLQHKDVRMVHRLLLSMPDMVRTNGLRAWFERFSAVRFVMTDGNETIIIDKAHKAQGPGLADAIATPFWKFKANEGVAYKPIDFTEYAEAQIKKLLTDIKKAPAKDQNDPRLLLVAAMRNVLHPAKAAVVSGMQDFVVETVPADMVDPLAMQ